MAMDAVTRSIETENKSYMGNGTYSAMSWYLQSSVSAWWEGVNSHLRAESYTIAGMNNLLIHHYNLRKSNP